MAVGRNNVYLYAATENDYLKCLAAADVTGLPYEQCIGNYSEAWNLLNDADNLVIVVGGAALYAIYYNPCSWPNPASEPGGHTPFAMFQTGQGIAHTRHRYFVNAAGYTALDSLTLAVMLTYYAVYGAFPQGYNELPRQEIPQHVCVSGSKDKVTAYNPTTVSTSPQTPSPATSPSVGVYASFSGTAAVERAIQQGWPGIGVTAALGTQNAPYTSVLSGKPDEAVAEVLNKGNHKVWWLSFWTVSWPSSGVTFYKAGYDGGEYAARQIASYPGKLRPNYVILDPEGFNQPAQSVSQFQDFINGFVDGVKSVSSALEAGFYCNQNQYSTFHLSQLEHPAFIAIAPIGGNKPMVSGKNIKGFIAYYANCPVASDVTQVKRWGGLYNTVQFRDSGVDCGPA